MPGVSLSAGDGYVHPLVASQLGGILALSGDPAQLSKAGRALSTFTSMFAKQALGYPLGAKAYLTGQFLGNMFAVVGSGVGVSHYMSGVDSMVKLSMRGLDAFDNKLPVYLIDGVQLTERDLVAKTMRMFSHEILPGMDGKDAILKLDYFNPAMIVGQVAKLRAAATTNGELARELLNMAGRAHDSVLSPALRLAAIMDTASHIATVRAFAPRVNKGLTFRTPLTSWTELTDKVKATVPMFDDMGQIPRAIATVLPFSGWAMQNAPIQLADMVRSPSKWANMARIHALWNENAMGVTPSSTVRCHLTRPLSTG